MPLRILVLITGGRSDIQFLVETESGIRRAQADAIDVEVFRALHEALLDDSVPWVVDPDESPPELNPRFIQFRIGQEELTAHWQGKPVSFLCHKDSITLVSPKVTPAIDVIRRHVQWGEWRTVGALVFNTHRTHRPGQRDSANEPVAAGRILAVLAAEMLDLELVEPPGVFSPTEDSPQATWFNYLEADQVLTDNGVLSEAMLDRIDRQLHTLASSGQFDAVVTVLDGGIPPVKEFISAVANFRFGRVFEIHTPDVTGKGGQRRQPVTRIYAPHALPPAHAIRLRKTAVDLLRIQDFYGAYTIAGIARDDPRELRWVEEVELAHRILAGLPLEPAKGYPQHLAPWTGELPRCAVQALRVESALARSAIADAAVFTVSFAEAAQRDLLETSLRKLLNHPSLKINEFDKCIEFPGLSPTAHQRKVQESFEFLAQHYPRLLEGDTPRDKCIGLLNGHHGTQTLVFNSNSRQDSIWREEVVRNDALDDYFRRLFPVPPARADALVKLGKSRQPARDVRNLLAHSNIAPSLLTKVHREFCRLGIWLEPREALPGDRFLRQNEVTSILKDCGLDDAARLYQELIDGLVATIARR